MCAQFKTTTYSGINTYLFTSLDLDKCEGKNSIASKNKSFYIIGDTVCSRSSKLWYLILLDTSIVFLEKWFVKERSQADSSIKKFQASIPNLHERKFFASKEIIRLEDEERKRIEEEDKQAELLAVQKEKEDRKSLDSLNKLMDQLMVTARSKNLVLYDWSWYYANEYSSFAEVDITIINPYRQKIKYLWFTFRAYNPVDDIIRDGVTGKSDKTVQGIGPIEYSDKGSYHFENVFYSKVIDKIKITQIKVQFFDGTYKVISNPNKIIRDE